MQLSTLPFPELPKQADLLRDTPWKKVQNKKIRVLLLETFTSICPEYIAERFWATGDLLCVSFLIWCVGDGSRCQTRRSCLEPQDYRPVCVCLSVPVPDKSYRLSHGKMEAAILKKKKKMRRGTLTQQHSYLTFSVK